MWTLELWELVVLLDWLDELPPLPPPQPATVRATAAAARVPRMMISRFRFIGFTPVRVYGDSLFTVPGVTAAILSSPAVARCLRAAVVYEDGQCRL